MHLHQVILSEAQMGWGAPNFDFQVNMCSISLKSLRFNHETLSLKCFVKQDIESRYQLF